LKLILATGAVTDEKAVGSEVVESVYDGTAFVSRRREKLVGTNLSGAGGGICLFLDTLKQNMTFRLEGRGKDNDWEGAQTDKLTFFFCQSVCVERNDRAFCVSVILAGRVLRNIFLHEDERFDLFLKGLMKGDMIVVRYARVLGA
jgi:hypothetical protein